MRSRLVPLPSSSLHPPRAGSYLILLSACILASPSSVFPRRSSLLPPSLAKAADGTCDLQPGFPGIFAWAPRPWFSGFPGFLGFAQFLHCFSLHCIGWQCSASHLLVYCFVLHIALLTLLCIALMCTALHCLAFALLTFACNALRCIELASGFHDTAMYCTAIVLTPFLSLLWIASR